LLGQNRITSACAIASSTPGSGPRALRGRQIDAGHVVGCAVAREIFLEVHAAAARQHDVRRTRVLRHHEDARRHAERAAQLVGDRAEADALREPQRAMVAVREVAVAEPEPRLVAECAERIDHRGGVALEPVAARAIDATRERVGDDVDVGRHVHAVEAHVVARVHDRGDVAGGYRAHEPVEEARRTHAARERDDGRKIRGHAE
jgi:hypothetical protein